VARPKQGEDNEMMRFFLTCRLELERSFAKYSANNYMEPTCVCLSIILARSKHYYRFK